MSVKPSRAGVASLLLICASVGAGAFACLLGPSGTVPESGGGRHLNADPGAFLIAGPAFSAVGLGVRS